MNHVKPLGPWIIERPKQYVVDNRKQCRRRPNADCQYQHCCQGESRRLLESPEGVAKVLKENHNTCFESSSSKKRALIVTQAVKLRLLSVIHAKETSQQLPRHAQLDPAG